MSPAPICILYSQDADLVRRVKAYLGALAEVRHVKAADRLEAVLDQTGPALLLLDLHAREAREFLETIRNSQPAILIIALGTARSEPLREAEQSNIYAAEEFQIDRRRLQALVSHGFEHIRVRQENQELRDEISNRSDMPSSRIQSHREHRE